MDVIFESTRIVLYYSLSSKKKKNNKQEYINVNVCIYNYPQTCCKLSEISVFSAL